MAKLTKLERSQKAHARLAKAQEYIDKNGNFYIINGHKYRYHCSVWRKQEKLNKVLSRTQRKKIWYAKGFEHK